MGAPKHANNRRSESESKRGEAKRIENVSRETFFSENTVEANVTNTSGAVNATNAPDTANTADAPNTASATNAPNTLTGEVIKLDRGLPTVKLESGSTLLCEHSASLVKEGEHRAVVGDAVEVAIPREHGGHDVGIIQRILPRRTQFVRKDPTERALPQVLAANFDQIIIAQPAGEVNLRRLERELVLAFETGARVAIVLTKADLIEDTDGESIQKQVEALAGNRVPVLTMAAEDTQSIKAVRELMPAGTTTVLMGRSGVGKSTLVNILYGEQLQKTSAVRESDGKGRHTTVNREIIEMPNGARIVDMPGVRGLGLWEADAGIDAAFADIEELAANCRFRDCHHKNEPGCAVRAALDNGQLTQQRYDSYLALRNETAAMAKRREQARWRNGNGKKHR